MTRNEHDERAGHYAGIISRSAAFILDAVAFTLGVLGALFVMSAVVALIKGDPFTMQTTDSALPETMFLVGSIVYFAGAWWIFGRTLGEAVFGLRVVRSDGRRVGLGRSLIRFLFMTLGLTLLGLGYLWMLVDRRRRTWGDIVARTVVVYDFGADLVPLTSAEARALAEAEAGPPSLPPSPAPSPAIDPSVPG